MSPLADGWGIGAVLKTTYTDTKDVRHHLLVRGPFVRCRDHVATPERESLAAALAGFNQRRACTRLRLAWQRHMLAAEPKMGPVRLLPAELRDYLDEQTAKHAERLDLLLGDGPPDARARRRWHEVGWRAAPTLASRYQDVGVEAAVAFLAYRRGFEPLTVLGALDDPTSALAKALVESRRHGYTVRQLELGQHALVTDDLPYEPLDDITVRPVAPLTQTDWRVDLREWLTAERPMVAVEDILARSGLRGSALRDASAWVSTVAVGWARTGGSTDVDVMMTGLLAGIGGFRPRQRRRSEGSAAPAR